MDSLAILVFSLGWFFITVAKFSLLSSSFSFLSFFLRALHVSKKKRRQKVDINVTKKRIYLRDDIYNLAIISHITLLLISSTQGHVTKFPVKHAKIRTKQNLIQKKKRRLFSKSSWICVIQTFFLSQIIVIAYSIIFFFLFKFFSNFHFDAIGVTLLFEDIAKGQYIHICAIQVTNLPFILSDLIQYIRNFPAPNYKLIDFNLIKK